MDDKDGSSSDEDFSFIRPSLTKQIRNILTKYPDNGQIIKEILQNAEDAKASTVKFLYDETSSKTIFDLGKPELTGPALYVYNDGVFTENDWKGIRMLEDSFKEKDPLKIGRFGLGFKSIFHLTDYPSIISGTKYGISCPSELLFGKGKDGKLRDFHRYPPNRRDHRDTSNIYSQIFNTNVERGECEGTLFRLPLRKSPSQISSTIYDSRKIRNLFQMFFQEGSTSLIFLQHLEKIEFYIRRQRSDKYELLRSIYVPDDQVGIVREARDQFTSDIVNIKSKQRPKSLSQTLQINIIEEDPKTICQFSFYVANVYAVEELENLGDGITADEAKKEGLAPMVGVALDIRRESSHVFCGLPLPVPYESLTGLPVHVNGFFALSPERNDLKRASAADGKNDDKGIRWNEFLAHKALPVAYVKLIQFILSQSNSREEPACLYKALPCFENVRSDWKQLAEDTFRGIDAMAFLWTPACGGQFTSIQSAVFMRPNEDREGMIIAGNAMILNGEKVVQVPEHISSAIEQFWQVQQFDPAYVRVFLRSAPLIISSWSKHDKLKVLLSVLENTSDLEELNNVKILPLLNGGFCKVICHTSSFYSMNDQIYVCSKNHPSSLIPGMKDRIVYSNEKKLDKLFYQAAKENLCQLRLLDSSSMVGLAKEMQLSRGNSVLDYSTDWLKKFWEYILHKRVSLSLMEGMMLVPLDYKVAAQSVRLVCLKQQSAYLYLDKPAIVDIEMQKALICTGCTIIHELPDCILNRADVFGKYVYKCIPEGILAVFVNLYRKSPRNMCRDVEQHFGEPKLRQKLVGVFSGVVAELNESQKEMLCSLPLFKVYGYNSYVSINKTDIIAPRNLRVFPEIQMLENSDQKTLARKLGATVISLSDLITKYLIPELSQCLTTRPRRSFDNLVDVILAHAKKLQESSNQELNMEFKVIASQLKGIQFFPNNASADALFDPQDSMAKKIFKFQSFFPPDKYMKYTKVLRSLGLRSAKDITQREILDVVSNIELSMRRGEKNEGNEQSTALLQLFNDYPEILRGNLSILAEIKQRKWIKVSQERPVFYPNSLMWYQERSGRVFESPMQLFHESNAFLVGAHNPVTNESLNIVLGYRGKEPSCSDTLKQLKIVISSYKGEEKAAYVNILGDIYRFLSKCKSEAIHDNLNFVPNWVWNGSGFAKPSQIIIYGDERRSSIDFRPYMFEIPVEMLEFKELLLLYGAFAVESNMCLISVLKIIANAHESNSGCINTIHDRKVVKLIQEILEELCQRELEEAEMEHLLLPTRSNEAYKIHLTPRSNCLYSACARLNVNPSDFFDNETKEKDRLAHQIISRRMAKKFRLKEFHSHILDAEGLLFEQFGQHEPLTTRLNRLLGDYRDGLAIPKELLQNADDAGATEIRFLYDERQNQDAKSSLLAPEMKSLQGPALWVFNDATFTNEDFNNLTKLHGGTKREKADKIGKFGLGFNSVYNLTDVPSLVSDDSMVIFDPHTCYLKEHVKNESQPGIKWKLENKKAIMLYQDQWKPYDGIFDLSLSPKKSVDRFKGTLFRFPLRTQEQASRSEIKNLAYDKKEMKMFIYKLLEGAERLLLFTQSVSRLTVYHLADNAKTTCMTEIFLMEKENVKIARPLTQKNRSSKLNRSVLSVAADMVTKREQPDPNMSYHYILSVKRSLSRSAIMFGNNINSFQGNDSWFITSYIDSGDCFTFAVNCPGHNPSASVAIKVLLEGGEPKPIPLYSRTDRGHLFCHVPLPIATNFPVHLNGSFAVTTSRQALKETSEDDKNADMAGPTWNRLLMKGPVAKAYVLSLECMTKSWNGTPKEWFRLWPCQTDFGDKTCFLEMVRGFCSTLIGEQARVLPVVEKKWCSWDEMFLLNEEFPEDEVLRSSIIIVCKILFPERKFVDMPKEVKETVSYAGFCEDVNKKSISPQQFFKIFMKSVENSNLPSSVRDTVTKYALLTCTDDDLIRNSNCIPTLPKGTLNSPSRLVDYSSEAKNLYFDEEEVFPSEEFQEGQLKNRLRELGMVYEYIPISIFEERADTINDLNRESNMHALSRSRILVHLLKQLIKIEPDTLADSNLCNIPFLPVCQEPAQWNPMPWGGKGTEMFLPPSKLFCKEYSALIGCHSAVVDESVKSGCGSLGQELSSALKIKDKIDIKNIQNQVKQLSRINGRLPEIAKYLFGQIYEWLQRHLKEIPEEAIRIFSKSPTILIGHHLINPIRVSFEISFEAKPYLYYLPDDYLSNYETLMKKIGVKQKFSCKDYTSALQAMKEDFKGSEISMESVKLSRNLLESIKETGGECLPKDEVVYVPDSKRILRLSSDVCINSHPWIPKQDDLNYVHPDIPSELAKFHGAKEARSDYFQKNSIGLPFGQHEHLTVRLKKILDSYCVEDQIMNEMLQNADDAKATEVHLILDPREHGCNKIFCEEWKSLQGPALLIRNNGVFRQEDLEGIQRLGEGSKTEDLFASGKYGVGFNVVYHLTDSPALLTSIKGEDILCLFDPQAKYVKGSTKASPGLKICNAIEKLRQIYTDLQSSFLMDSLEDRPATLLRLPLRNKKMAESSEISNKEISVQKVKEMLESFQRNLMSSVIFLNHIEKIKISEINVTTGIMTEIYSVTLQCDENSRHQKNLLAKDIENVAKSMRANDDSFEALPCRHYRLQTNDSKRRFVKWQIIQRVGPTKHIPESVKHHGLAKMSCLPVGGIACQETLDKGNETHKQGEDYGRYFSLLPLTLQTNMPLNVNGQFILEHESRHRLWSTKIEGFQRDWNTFVLECCVTPCYAEYIKMRANRIEIHFKKGTINEVVAKTYPGGYTPERDVSSNQKTDSDAKGNEPANKSTAKDRIFSSEGFFPQDLYRYFKVFPSWPEKDDAYNSSLKRRLYELLADSKALVLPVLRPRHSEVPEKIKPEWFPPASSTEVKYFVPDFTVQGAITKETQKKMIRDIRSIIDLLLKEGMNIFNIPKFIQEAFERAERPLTKLDASSTKEHLKDKGELISLSNKILKEDKLNMIRIVLKFCEIQSLEELDRLPLLVTEDKILRTFSNQHPIFVDTISELFNSKRKDCLHQEIRSILTKPIMALYEAAIDMSAKVPLKRFEINDLVTALNEDPTCSGLKAVNSIYEIPLNEKLFPSESWLKKLWTFLCRECERICQNKVKENFECKNSNSKEAGDKNETLIQEFRQQLTKKLLQPLSDWCLVPAERCIKGNAAHLQRLIIPMKNCKTVLNDYSHLHEPLCQIQILRMNGSALQRYKPSIQFGYSSIIDPNKEFVSRIVASVREPNSFLCALHMQSFKDPGCFERINEDQRNKILEELNKKSWDDEMREQIRSLKIFTAINEKPHSISDKVIIPPDAVPSEGSEIWMSKFEVIACKSKDSLKNLYEFFGFIQVNDVDIYGDYIFPCFKDMSEDERYAHLIYIRNRDGHKSHKCNVNSKHCPLFDMLADIPFLFRNGKYFCAKDLYDHKNSIFALFLPEMCFPPKRFNDDDDWIMFLKHLGLTTEVSSAKYLEFAQQVESINISEKKREKSNALIDCLFSTKNLHTDSRFLQRVSRVKYLIHDESFKKLSEVAPAFVETNSNICFRDSFAVSNFEDESRIWTVAAMLPSYVLKHVLDRRYERPLHEFLGIECKLLPKLVESNFIRVIESDKVLHSNHIKIVMPPIMETVLRISNATYEFLSQNKEYTLSQDFRSQESVLIRGTKNHVLVKPCDATLASNVDLKPFIWTVGTYFGKFFDFFKSIGVTDKPSCVQLAGALEKIAGEFQGVYLDANSAKLAHRAVEYLGVALAEQNDIGNVQTLYLPSASLTNMQLQYLLNSSDLIYLDDMSKYSRLQGLDQPCLVYTSETKSMEKSKRDIDMLVKRLPKRLQPKPLSELIDEEMVPAEMIRNGDVAESLLTSIQSREFIDGLLMLHNSEGQSTDDVNVKKDLKEVLTQIEITTFNSIETIIKYKGKEELPKSRARKTCFIVKEADRLVVNITEIAEDEKMLLCSMIAKELVSQLHSVIVSTESATLIPLLLAMPPNRMMKTLGMCSGVTQRESDEYFTTHNPKPGDFVPTELHWMLNNSFEEYDVEEFIAYEIEDPDSHESVFIYSVVRRKIQENDDLDSHIRNHRYEICIGENKLLQVESFQIYKFNPSESGAINTLANAEDTSTDHVGLTYEEAKKAIMQCLQQATLLEGDKKRLLIKSLYREWHPDKNENKDFFTKVFQFLLGQVQKMEQGDELFGDEDGTSKSTWDETFDSWGQEARRNHNFKNKYQSRPRGFGSFWRGSPNRRSNSNPQPHEARRWYRQAKLDFDAAESYRTNQYFEWKCFKCHQAAEKALKAGLFAINADKSMDHNLRILASDLPIDGIQESAGRLESLLGSSTKMRYPDRWVFPTIPHEGYTHVSAEEAVQITNEILNKVGDFITQTETFKPF